MSPSLPPRRFAPTPVETTTKSSKAAREQPIEKDEKPKPRRFNVEPVDTEQKSSRSKDAAQPRRFNVEPVESTTKSSKDREVKEVEKPKPRRFAPEPVETEHKSSKDKREGSEKSQTRRFAPQLVENTSTLNDSMADLTAEAPRIRFTPQPVETIYRTNRRPQDGAEGKQEKRAPRRFAPVVVDNAKRSRRAGDSNPALSPHHKTEFGHNLHAREHRRHIRGDRSPVGEGEGDGNDGHVSPADMLALHPELRRQIAPMDGRPGARRLSATSARSHSFRCPDLDTIESSGSEPLSQSSSLSSSPGQDSPITASDSSYTDMYKHATRKRESVDETFQHYLLQLEAKKAQQRLEEQALAAFPNSDFHEPVQHYVDIDDDSDEMEIEDRPVTWAGFEDDLLLSMAARRESTAKISWEQQEMQRHAERLEQDRNAERTTAKQPSQSPWWSDRPTFGLGQTDNELKSMQDRARPPMLGSDIVFPRCPSPEPARFDVTQGSTTLRNQMCYLTEHVEAGKRSDDEVGLWHAPDQENEHVVAARSKANSPKKASADKGLWGGFCFDDGEHSTPMGGLAVPTGPTGLMTPAVEPSGNPFEHSFAVPSAAAMSLGDGIRTPDTPPRSLRNGDLGQIDSVLSAEHELDDLMETEYPDSFITQVYNYLSLGYPSLAKPFDEELSKISRVPIADLRQDDKKAKSLPRGYIRLGPDFEGGGGDGLTEQECMRWQALRVYIREWARQEKDMVKDEGLNSNWGTLARRGSWAI